jgi:acyl carrier protein
MTFASAVFPEANDFRLSSFSLGENNAMTTDIDDQLAEIVRSHIVEISTAATGAGLPSGLELRAELGLDPIELAEIALEIEEAFEIEIDAAELAACSTLGHLSRLIHAKPAE